MIQFTTGNLLDADVQALINTVNTAGVMGKGIALQFKNAFPHNFAVYQQACLSGTFKIGQILVVREARLIMGERIIINLPTKQHWRNPSRYEYIESGLIALKSYVQNNPVQSLAIPALGCGNGGLDWNKVRPMMEHALTGLEIPIWIYEPVK